MSSEYNLERFIDAQEASYEIALVRNKIRQKKKPLDVVYFSAGAGFRF
jgi:uncharacterized protein (DUF1810 family)